MFKSISSFSDKFLIFERICFPDLLISNGLHNFPLLKYWFVSSIAVFCKFLQHLNPWNTIFKKKKSSYHNTTLCYISHLIIMCMSILKALRYDTINKSIRFCLNDSFKNVHGHSLIPMDNQEKTNSSNTLWENHGNVLNLWAHNIQIYKNLSKFIN